MSSGRLTADVTENAPILARRPAEGFCEAAGTRLVSRALICAATPASARSARAVRSLLPRRAGEQPHVLAVSLGLELVGRDEAQRRRVHAVAEARGRGAVIEHVPEVGIGVRRADLRPGAEERAVGLRLDVGGHEWAREARPSGAGVELVERGEERLAGDD